MRDKSTRGKADDDCQALEHVSASEVNQPASTSEATVAPTDRRGARDARKEPALCLLGPSRLDRLAYRLLLKQHLGWDLAADADFVPTAVWTALRTKPDAVLIDAGGPTSPAVEAAVIISRLRPSARVLVMGNAVDPLQLQAWRHAKIHAYVVKDAGLDELRRALREVLAARSYFSEGVRRAIQQDRDRGTGANKTRLSRRESELLPLLARGLPLREAAQQMTVSYKTADSYRTSLLRKLGLRDRVELARYAIRERIVDP